MRRLLTVVLAALVVLPMPAFAGDPNCFQIANAATVDCRRQSQANGSSGHCNETWNVAYQICLDAREGPGFGPAGINLTLPGIGGGTGNGPGGGIGGGIGGGPTAPEDPINAGQAVLQGPKARNDVPGETILDKNCRVSQERALWGTLGVYAGVGAYALGRHLLNSGETTTVRASFLLGPELGGWNHLRDGLMSGETAYPPGLARLSGEPWRLSSDAPNVIRPQGMVDNDLESLRYIQSGAASRIRFIDEMKWYEVRPSMRLLFVGTGVLGASWMIDEAFKREYGMGMVEYYMSQMPCYGDSCGCEGGA